MPERETATPLDPDDDNLPWTVVFESVILRARQNSKLGTVEAPEGSFGEDSIVVSDGHSLSR